MSKKVGMMAKEEYEKVAEELAGSYVNEDLDLKGLGNAILAANDKLVRDNEEFDPIKFAARVYVEILGLQEE